MRNHFLTHRNSNEKMQNMGKKQLTFQNPYNIITKCVT